MIQSSYPGAVGDALVNYPEACYKVVKASVVSQDEENYFQASENLTKLRFTTKHVGEGLVFIWPDRVSYENRTPPIGHLFVFFPLPSLRENILELAYNQIPIQLEKMYGTTFERIDF